MFTYRGREEECSRLFVGSIGLARARVERPLASRIGSIRLARAFGTPRYDTTKKTVTIAVLLPHAYDVQVRLQK